MIVCGLTRLASTIRNRSCPTEYREPTPARFGARDACSRSSGKGPEWHSRHRPSCRLTRMARPRAGSPAASVSDFGMVSPAISYRVSASPAISAFVHKTLAINRVLISVHAAPETGPDRGVVHRMVDQHVRNVIAERSLCPTRVETLKHCRIHPILQILRQDCRQNGLAGNAHLKADKIATPVQAAAQFTLRDRVIEVVRHVLFARPHQLDRRARHLHRDSYRLARVVRENAAAEPATEQRLVDIAFIDRQARGFGNCGKNSFAILGRTP